MHIHQYVNHRIATCGNSFPQFPDPVQGFSSRLYAQFGQTDPAINIFKENGSRIPNTFRQKQ